MTLRRLVLLRHGETDFNAEGRMQGHVDALLSALGLAQAREVAPALAPLRPARLLSSDLRRAADTADEIGAACGLAVKLDPRLRETHLGEWQGRTEDEIEARWPGRLVRWRADPRFAPPGGESRVAVVERARPVVTELDDEFAEAAQPVTALVCAHGGLVAGLVAGLLELPEPSWPSIAGLGNCKWATLTRRSAGAHWRLAAYNQGAAG